MKERSRPGHRDFGLTDAQSNPLPPVPGSHARVGPGREERPAPIELGETFRQLIIDELRNGRLTPVRRRRIVRYAAHLGVSAVEAGHLIAVCREEVRRKKLAKDDVRIMNAEATSPTRGGGRRARLAIVIGVILVLGFLWM